MLGADDEEDLEGEEETSESEEEENNEEQVVDECGASPSRSELSCVLDEVLDANTSNEEYDEESDDSDDYSDDGFDSDDEELEKLKGIATDLKQLSTLAPGEFQSLLGVLQAESE